MKESIELVSNIITDKLEDELKYLYNNGFSDEDILDVISNVQFNLKTKMYFNMKLKSDRYDY